MLPTFYLVFQSFNMSISKTGYHTMFIAGFSKSTGRPSLLFVALTAVLNLVVLAMQLQWPVDKPGSSFTHNKKSPPFLRKFRYFENEG